MREQLAKYVELLFADTTDTDEIQQEILQNTLDRYDDMVAQGKAPEAAYRLAISGIGDINEILGQQPQKAASPSPALSDAPMANRKLLRSIAIALYILCAVPLFLTDGSTLGLCLTIIIVAVATAIMVYTGKGKGQAAQTHQQSAPFPAQAHTPGLQIARCIIWGSGICLYIGVSLLTHAWWITWLIFPMLACVQGIATAIFDLKEACKK